MKPPSAGTTDLQVHADQIHGSCTVCIDACTGQGPQYTGGRRWMGEGGERALVAVGSTSAAGAAAAQGPATPHVSLAARSATSSMIPACLHAPGLKCMRLRPATDAHLPISHSSPRVEHCEVVHEVQILHTQGLRACWIKQIWGFYVMLLTPGCCTYEYAKSGFSASFIHFLPPQHNLITAVLHAQDAKLSAQRSATL